MDHHSGDFTWQDADEWWGNAVALTRQLLRRHPVTIDAISLSGRGGAAVFLNHDGTVLAHPWSDRRHAGFERELNAWRRQGAWLSNYAMALLAKKQWLIANEPIRARGLRHVLYAKDLLLFRLTHQAITDPTSGPDADTWDAAALAHTNTSAGMLPTPRLPWSIAGPLTVGAARALDLPSGIPVVVGGHDGICANVGAGAAGIGDYAVTLGTHAVVRAIREHTPAGAYRFYGLPLEKHVIGGNAVLAGRAADWFLDLLYGANDRARARHFSELDGAAAQVDIGAGGVSFLPFLAGQVAPEARPRASGVFVGLRATHDRAALFRAVLEGGACAIRRIFAQIVDWCGEPNKVRLTGSGALSALWPEILANLLQRDLEVSDGAVEGRGAAIFAAVALNDFATYEQAADAMVSVTRTYSPRPELSAAYDHCYQRWVAAVDATRGMDHL